jgi:MurNAc alpha-1-phosphate uridylyltransferase
MKIKYGMILAAGLGKRMQPITIQTPKPLIKIGNKNLLERSIELLIDHNIEEIVVNVHYLANQIKDFIKEKKYKIKITISDEQNVLLDTGGGISQGTKPFKDKPFIVINPDTIWSKNYSVEIQKLEELYFKEKKPCILLVNKNLSFDSSFKGDFNLDANIVSRDINNQFIFTGLQVLNQDVFRFTKDKKFSMNKIWDKLIYDKNLAAIESSEKFYHLNTKETYDKLLSLNIID